MNTSTFIESDKLDDARQMHYFHNFYAIYQVTPKFGATFGFDFGVEEKAEQEDGFNTWYSPVVIVRYTVNERINLAARVEYYSDQDGVIISTGTPNGFKTFGYSANIDYLFAEKVLWRNEIRGLRSEDDIFTDDDDPSSSFNCAFTSSLSVWF